MKNIKMDDLKTAAEFLQAKAKGAGLAEKLAAAADSTTGMTAPPPKKEQAEKPIEPEELAEVVEAEPVDKKND